MVSLTSSFLFDNTFLVGYINRVQEKFLTSEGSPVPFGASPHQEGVNFSLFSSHAVAVSLCLFEPGQDHPFCEIPLKHKTGDTWHIFIHDLPHHLLYGYRVDGPYDPLKGFLYDNRCILLDPYTKRVASRLDWGSSPRKDISHIQKGYIDPFHPFDWEEDAHPALPLKDLIIYEMHVRGFTQDPSSNVQHPGTYLGFIEKIPYLTALGINAVELMPLHEFNERDNQHFHAVTGEPLYQYWGYSTINFFSLMERFGSQDPILEFKTLVKELHKAGIEVILDVVYNHTGEGNQEGPILSFKGIENSVYYLLGPGGDYYNFSGCGNTFNCNSPPVRELIRDSLRYWVTEMHVDGFRFDLASILTRGHDGIPLKNPPLIDALTDDPILANTKLIAEPWDAGGLYQVGSFPKMAEWNGKYRDDVRRFLKGTDGVSGLFGTRISGSEDLYGKGRSPAHSINFITSHDGFTLADLVSYNEKHNEENGEDGRDGHNDNESWNCGAEGETDDPQILALRQRQIRNFLLALMISQGVPMLLMGDEYGHTKFGNNNTWGHDSRLNWFQWDTLEKTPELFRFTQKVIALRKAHPILTRSRFLRDSDVIWHGVDAEDPDWASYSRALAFTLPDTINHEALYIAFNASFVDLTYTLPAGQWLRLVDTSFPSPEDIHDEAQAPTLSEQEYTLPSHSALLLKTNL